MPDKLDFLYMYFVLFLCAEDFYQTNNNIVIPRMYWHLILYVLSIVCICMVKINKPVLKKYTLILLISTTTKLMLNYAFIKIKQLLFGFVLV